MIHLPPTDNLPLMLYAGAITLACYVACLISLARDLRERRCHG